MRILVTGAGGFVGRCLVPLLADQGNEVIALLRQPNPELARAWPELGAVQVRVMDLERPAFAELPDVEAVVALAQSRHFREFPDKADSIFAVNIGAHFALLEWARASGVRRIVYASSGGIYGPTARRSVAEDELLAVDSPLGFYLGSKLCAEVLFQNYRHFFDTAVILRPFFIYGPGQREDMLLPRLLRAVGERRPIQLQGRDGLRLNPVFVEDAARAFSAALHVKGSEVLNVAGPDIVSLRRLGEIIGGFAGTNPVFEQLPGEPSDYVGDTRRATALIGPCAVGIVEGLRRTIAESP